VQIGVLIMLLCSTAVTESRVVVAADFSWCMADPRGVFEGMQQVLA